MLCKSILKAGGEQLERFYKTVSKDARLGVVYGYNGF